MAALAAAAPYMMAAGTLLSAKGQRQAGKASQRQAGFDADQLEIAAGRSKAVSQRESLEHKRQGKLAQSRALAVGAFGGGASDPTVVKTISDLAGETAYRSAVALYGGESKAQNYMLRAGQRRMEGEAARKAGKMNSLTTILGGAGEIGGMYRDRPQSLFDKYSGGEQTFETYPGTGYD